jgi:hypothetical protein
LNRVIAFRFLIKPRQLRNHIPTDQLTLESIGDRKPMRSGESLGFRSFAMRIEVFPYFAGDLVHPCVERRRPALRASPGRRVGRDRAGFDQSERQKGLDGLSMGFGRRRHNAPTSKNDFDRRGCIRAIQVTLNLGYGYLEIQSAAFYAPGFGLCLVPPLGCPQRAEAQRRLSYIGIFDNVEHRSSFNV